MWLKYQKVSSKMSSFDPREFVKHNNKDEETVKYPLKRFEPTLRTSLKVVIPMNLDRLKKHKVNVEKYMQTKKWRELNIEQINASRTVQQLQATIRDLDKIRHQIQENDVEQFDKQIAGMKVEALTAVQEFCSLKVPSSNKDSCDDLQSNIHQDGECSGSSRDTDSSVRQRTSIKSSDYHSAGSTLHDSSNSELETPNSDMAAVQAMHSDEEHAAYQSWDNLKSGLIDLDSLVKDFAACVHQQQEMIDNIEDNIENTHQNVNAAANLLGQASKYKAAMVPVAGAVVGGLLAGPIGLLAGFKLAGAAAAVGGGIAGYQGGKYWKKKHDKNVELELSHLSRCDKNT